jgi:hypothetical protein
MIVKAVFLLGLAIAASGFASPPVALALGLVFGFTFPHPFDKSAKKLSRYLLQASVVGLGFGMNLHDVVRAGRSGFVYTVLGIGFTMVVGMTLGAMLKCSVPSFPISTGTAICGAAPSPPSAPSPAPATNRWRSPGHGFYQLVALLTFPPLVRVASHRDPVRSLGRAAIHDKFSSRCRRQIRSRRTGRARP